ncbi:hypothetical protein ElyMa_002287800 [Elysia marginata]|uniref:Uncharacterized protein n=1 Tax=Elysia marginata TaxID=1093978 RepID=A0AAV4G1Q0_9GAST|nr:hypothetical protein ElyMa_002287800 [Elysia marginata]
MEQSHRAVFVMRYLSSVACHDGQVGNTHPQHCSKWEPTSPCTVCHSHNTLASSGLSIASSPQSARDTVRAKSHAHHSQSCRGQPVIASDAIAMGGATQDQTNGNSSRVAEVFTGLKLDTAFCISFEVVFKFLCF